MGRGTAKGGLPARSPGGFNDPPCEVQKNLKVRHGILHAVIRSRQDAPESTRTPTLLNEQGNHSFNHNLRGFGYRHCHLHVPFTFWNEIDRTFWDPHQSQTIVDTTGYIESQASTSRFHIRAYTGSTFALPYSLHCLSSISASCTSKYKR